MIAIPLGPAPTGTVATTVLVAALITETLLRAGLSAERAGGESEVLPILI
ncbi:MAG TPA: hypothetical protein VN843_09255 [Anaerolineales bacterium]|nr:hypothetical protein [Anaerolineales bacterium]